MTVLETCYGAIHSTPAKEYRLLSVKIKLSVVMDAETGLRQVCNDFDYPGY
jgi:hypothetical protein